MNSDVKGTDSGLELAHTEYTDVHVSQGGSAPNHNVMHPVTCN